MGLFTFITKLVFHNADVFKNFNIFLFESGAADLADIFLNLKQFELFLFFGNILFTGHFFRFGKTVDFRLKRPVNLIALMRHFIIFFVYGSHCHKLGLKPAGQMPDELKITVIARIVGESQPLLGINRQNVALMFILNLRGVYKDIRIFFHKHKRAANVFETVADSRAAENVVNVFDRTRNSRQLLTTTRVVDMSLIAPDNLPAFGFIFADIITIRAYLFNNAFNRLQLAQRDIQRLAVVVVKLENHRGERRNVLDEIKIFAVDLSGVNIFIIDPGLLTARTANGVIKFLIGSHRIFAIRTQIVIVKPRYDTVSQIRIKLLHSYFVLPLLDCINLFSGKIKQFAAL